MMPPRTQLITSWIALLCTAAALPGCKFKPGHNMEEQPSAHPPYKPSEVFENGSTARAVPPATVSRAARRIDGTLQSEVAQSLPLDTAATWETSVIPFEITPEILSRGQQRFDIYCSACHGRLGDGNGMIVQRGLTPPPSFHIERLRDAADGHFYNVISNGYGQMFSYNDRVRPEDRWMITAYIRALQVSTASDAKLKPLTDTQRRRLEGNRP